MKIMQILMTIKLNFIIEPPVYLPHKKILIKKNHTHTQKKKSIKYSTWCLPTIKCFDLDNERFEFMCSSNNLDVKLALEEIN